MLEVKFYEQVDDALLKFAVILSRTQGKWVFCKHRERTTYEIPGGHREPGETIQETAERELREETGAVEFDMKQVGVYSVKTEESETFGMLFVADISDKKWGVGVYFSTAFLSLFLITDKEAALTYALFFGYYPLIKDIIEKLPKAWGWLLKLALFNASAVGIGVISFYLFGVSGEEYEEFGKFTIPILLIMANVAFVLYDFCITKNRFLLMRLSERFKKIIK